MKPSFRRELLDQILSQPTSPFREGHVISVLTQTLSIAQVPHFTDPVGNIVIGAASRKDYEALLRSRSDEPVRIFIAHMDHPGFHGVSWTDDDRLNIQWHGGSPTAHLTEARVWLADRSGWQDHGFFADVTMHPSGRMIQSGLVRFQDGKSMKERFPRGTELFGGFGFRSPVWEEDQKLYTKAADDLVGCFAVVSTALELFKKAPKGTRKGGLSRPPFLGLLTRAEEVGFIGTIGHLELGWLQGARRSLLAVSLETSRTLPGAEIGKGPVVRLGDKFTVFDPGMIRVFTDLAEKTVPGAYQRRIMDGGTCEATAATAYGIPSIGISVPLGNYHNQSFEGGPDSRGTLGPAPEFVHLNDVQGLLELCRGLMKPGLPWSAPWDKKRKDLLKSLRNYRKLLKSKP